MALDFSPAHHKFIKKKITLATVLSVVSHQHLLTHCKYSCRVFVTPSVHLLDKLCGDSHTTSALPWGQSRSYSPGRSTHLTQGEELPLHPLGIPDLLPFLLFLAR